MSLVFGAGTGDKVALPSGFADNTFDPITVLLWAMITTRTNGRRLWGKGGNNSMFFSFSQPGVEVTVPRATTNASARSTKTYTLNKMWLFALTFDSTDGPRIFTGDLTTEASEDPYDAGRTAGAGAVTTDAAQPWTIGNLGGAAVAFQGSQSIFAKFRRRMTPAEIIKWQFAPFTDADCDIFIELGFDGTGVQANKTSLGSGNNGTVTGATVGDHVPILPAFRRRRVKLDEVAILPQRSRPMMDIANPGTFTREDGSSVNLVASINEAVVNDATFIQSPSSIGITPKIFRSWLDPTNPPGPSQNTILKTRYQRDAPGQGSLNLKSRLHQGGGLTVGGGTVIVERSFMNVAAGYVEDDYILSGAEVAAITDWGQLYHEIEVWLT